MGDDPPPASAVSKAIMSPRSPVTAGWPPLLMATLLLAAAPGRAQHSPDTQQIIEALKPSPTRSLRNLVARERPAESGADAASVAAQDSAPPMSKGWSGQALAAAPASPAGAGAAPGIDLTIQFDFASSRIRAESLPLLANLAAALQSPELHSSRFLVEGHTDAVGSAAHNLKLSIHRAEEVRRFLVNGGVAGERVIAAGRGATNPVNAVDPNAGENRRVRVVTLQ